MLEVTREALQYFRRELQVRQAPDHAAMRLSRGSGQLEVFPDQKQPGDRGFHFEDRTVLVIDERLADQLDGQRLGIVESQSGETRLRLEALG